MTRKKILLCGATGFIGRNILEYFQKRDDVSITAIWHKRPPFEVGHNVEWQHADLRNPSDIARVVPGHHQIIQAAATTSGSKDIVATPYVHVTDNAVMNSYLLRACYDAAVEHFVFFSCSVMYPSSANPVREVDFTGDLEDRYFGVGWTKVYIERMCEFYANLGRTKHTVIRHSNIYGPYDKFDMERSHVFGASLSKAMLAENEINIWGTGEEKRDLLHVDDLTNFVSLALRQQKQHFGLYNCGSGEAISVKNLGEKRVSATGKNLVFRHDLSKPSIPFSLALNCQKAEEELGWCPDVVIDEGIASTVKWWRDNIDPASLLMR